MNKIPDNKSSISDEDILFIGIPEVKNNLTLNLENPLRPEETLWAEGGEPMPRVKPAGILTEYKIIIVDPDDLGAIHNPSHAFERRRVELRNFLAQGGLLVCILRKANGVRCFQSQEQVMNYDFIVQGWHNFTEPRGATVQKFSITAEGHSSSFLEILERTPQVAIYIDNLTGQWGIWKRRDSMSVAIKPLAITTNRKTIAFEAIPTEGEMQGKMVFLPDYALNDVELLVKCAKQELMQMGTAGFVPAEWTNNYGFPHFDKYASEIKDLKIKLKEIQTDIERKETEFSELKRIRDALLNGQGKILEKTVRQVFNEMGIPFEDGPPKQEDLVLKENHRTVLVGEVKGKKRTADKDDLMKLMSWVNRIEKEGDDNASPKGLLIMNAWKDNDPTERTKPAFPDPIEKIGIANKFCLMTTLQLYNMWCAFRKGNFKGGQQLLNKILETVGIFPGFDDPSENRIQGKATQ